MEQHPSDPCHITQSQFDARHPPEEWAHPAQAQTRPLSISLGQH